MSGEALAEARARTLALLRPLPEEALLAQHDPLLSPLVWDLAHIGHFEELWLARTLGGAEPLDERLDVLYDAASHERAERVGLPLLRVGEALAYLEQVRARALDGLARPAARDARLVRDGVAASLVLQHEYQHCETMLQALQLLPAGYLPDAAVELPPGAGPGRGAVEIPAGPFVLGTDDPCAYDNERPAHVVELDGFAIDALPVSNAQFALFVEDGGYRSATLWRPEGHRFVEEHGLAAPKHWYRDGAGAWRTTRFGHDEPLDPHRPVVHVCWYEADAFARWAGKRLPTEEEWEKAASWDPAAKRKRRYPWGDEPPGPERCNLDQLAFATAPLGAYPAGASAYGVEQLLGDVWEWTASEFGPYPGFEAYPYREYSEVFFGRGYRVLRGGSFATRPGAIRTTFRNWDLPIRRQIFAGFRLAEG